MYGFIEKKSKDGFFDEIKAVFQDRFGVIPEELSLLIDVMKIKNLASVLSIDKITIKKTRVSFVFFNNDQNLKTKQKAVLFLLDFLNKENHKTDVKEKKGQLSVITKTINSVTETLNFLKKTTKKKQ